MGCVRAGSTSISSEKTVMRSVMGKSLLRRMPRVASRDIRGETELLTERGEERTGSDSFLIGLACLLAHQARRERLVFRSWAAALTELATACSEAGRPNSTFPCWNRETSS